MPLSKALKLKNEEIFTSAMKENEYLTLPQISLRLLIIGNKLQVSQEDIIKLKDVVSDKWIKKNTNLKIKIDGFDMKSDVKNDYYEAEKQKTRKRIEEHTVNPVYIKSVFEKEYKKQFKSFQKDNEDVLFYHNTAQQFGVASIEEFLPQLQEFYKTGLVVRKKYSKKFIKNNKTYMIMTFNSLDDDDNETDASLLSPIMTMFGTLISGFTYIIKYELYKQIKKHIKYIDAV